MANPLMCWDIVLEGAGRRKEFAHDLDALHTIVRKNEWRNVSERIFDSSVVWDNKIILVTDANQHILMATKNMYKMNGYQSGEVIGKTPKMFQGEATSSQSKKEIRTAIDNLVAFETNIVNYKKDGSLYNCHIEGFPVFNKRGRLVNFIAIENEV